jgi:hypothetical protein
MNLPLVTPWTLEMAAFWSVFILVLVNTSLSEVCGKVFDHIIGNRQGKSHEAE